MYDGGQCSKLLINGTVRVTYYQIIQLNNIKVSQINEHRHISINSFIFVLRGTIVHLKPSRSREIESSGPQFDCEVCHCHAKDLCHGVGASGHHVVRVVYKKFINICNGNAKKSEEAREKNN